MSEDERELLEVIQRLEESSLLQAKKVDELLALKLPTDPRHEAALLAFINKIESALPLVDQQRAYALQTQHSITASDMSDDLKAHTIERINKHIAGIFLIRSRNEDKLNEALSIVAQMKSHIEEAPALPRPPGSEIDNCLTEKENSILQTLHVFETVTIVRLEKSIEDLDAKIPAPECTSRTEILDFITHVEAVAPLLRQMQANLVGGRRLVERINLISEEVSTKIISSTNQLIARVAIGDSKIDTLLTEQYQRLIDTPSIQ